MTTKLAQHLQETTPLTGLDRATLVVMANMADENGELQTTSTALATELDCEPAEVRRSVKRLILLGCVSRHGEKFLILDPDSALQEENGGGTVSVSEPGGESTGGLETPSLRSGLADARRGLVRATTEERSDETVPTSSTVGKKPKVDAVFQNLAIVCGLNYKNLTKDERGRLNEATKQIKAVCEGAQDILDRAGRWHHIFPGAALTPQAIAANWGTLDPKNGAVIETQRERPEPTNTILDEDLVTDRTPEGRERAVNHIRQIRETLRASSRPG